MSMAFLLRVMRCNEIGPSSLAKGGTNGANSPKLKTTQKTKKQNKKKTFDLEKKREFAKLMGSFSIFIHLYLHFCSGSLFVIDLRDFSQVAFFIPHAD